jgi:hypothetical protein
MTDDHDPLEAELETLRPQEVSPELRSRIAARLSDQRPATNPWLWRSLALAGALAAACVAGALLLRNGEEQVVIEPPPPQPAPAEYESPPALWTYQRALTESPEAALVLVDQQAERSAGCIPPDREVRAFNLSFSNLLD